MAATLPALNVPQDGHHQQDERPDRLAERMLSTSSSPTTTSSDLPHPGPAAANRDVKSPTTTSPDAYGGMCWLLCLILSQFVSHIHTFATSLGGISYPAFADHGAVTLGNSLPGASTPNKRATARLTRTGTLTGGLKEKDHAGDGTNGSSSTARATPSSAAALSANAPGNAAVDPLSQVRADHLDGRVYPLSRAHGCLRHHTPISLIWQWK